MQTKEKLISLSGADIDLALTMIRTHKIKGGVVNGYTASLEHKLIVAKTKLKGRLLLASRHFNFEECQIMQCCNFDFVYDLAKQFDQWFVFNSKAIFIMQTFEKANKLQILFSTQQFR